MHVGHQIVCAVAASAGVKQSKMPSAPEPPELGWQQKEAEKAAIRDRKARNWMRRYGESAGLAMT